MVKRTAGYIAIGLAFTAGGAAGESATSLVIRSIVIEHAGIYKDARPGVKELAQSCSKTRFSDDAAKHWFDTAREVPSDGFNEQATITGCSSSGRLTTADGTAYDWQLDIGGSAILRAASSTTVVHLIGPEVPTDEAK